MENSLINKFDDVIESEGIWSQICKSHVEELKVPELMLNGSGHGICGVEGCSKEADHYIDFVK